MPEIGIYARVSTTDQDPQRQLDELREFAEDTYDQPAIHTYADIISGTKTDRSEEYLRLCSDIEDGVLDIVIVHELSRLSRLGSGEIHEFLLFCLSHETGIQDLEVGLEISLDDDLVDRAVSQIIAGVMGYLARVEHKQKLRRIQSSIDRGATSYWVSVRIPTLLGCSGIYVWSQKLDMVQHNSEALDMDDYRANTEDLLDSMQETTALMNEMADNMASLSDSFAAFDRTKDDLRSATAEMQQSGPSVAAD